MDQDTYFVPKRTGTYADVLLAYGLAAILDRLAGLARGEFNKPRMTIVDAGPYYEIRLSEPVRKEWVPDGLFFRSPAPFLTNRRTSADDVPPDTPTRDVDATREQVQAYRKMRFDLREENIRGSDLEGQLRDQEPPGDWTVVAFLGDGRMQALDAYNRIVAGWARSRDRVAEHIRTIFRLFSTPEGDEEALRAWEKGAGKAIPKARETASQLLNPHQGKGLNEPKAHALRIREVKNCPWPEQFLKAVGLWECMIPRQVLGTGDWKAYVLAPLRMDWRAHQDVMARFRRYLWNERRGDETSLKSDITSLLLFVRAWLDYVEAAGQDDVDLDADVAALAPERVVAGFHVAQFKLLSRNAYTMVNMSFLHLPQWTGTPRSRADILNVKEVIDEHLAVIREINETHSDGYNLLRAYRDFVAGNNWGAFFEFAAGYSHEIMRRYNEGARRVPTILSIVNLWIQTLQFGAGIRGGEVPFYPNGFLVPLVCPRLHLPTEGLFVRNSAFQTCPDQCAQLNFRHIQPTPVLGSVMELKPLPQPVGFSRIKGLIERCRPVSVEIIHHDNDDLGIRVAFIRQIPHRLRPIDPGAVFVHPNIPLACQRLKKQEKIADSVSLILVIFPVGLARLHREGRVHIY
jgi:hypothetical protein